MSLWQLFLLGFVAGAAPGLVILATAAADMLRVRRYWRRVDRILASGRANPTEVS